MTTITTEATTATHDNLPIYGTIYSDIPRENRITQMHDDLRAAIAAIVDGGDLATWLTNMATHRINRWSFRNQILAELQARAYRATLDDTDADKHRPYSLATAKEWKKRGRQPKPGTRALWILAPVTKWVTKTDPATGDDLRFKVVVNTRPQAEFDIAQTTGEPYLDTLGDLTNTDDQVTPPGVIEGLTARIRAAGYTYKEDNIAADPVAGRGTLGYTDPADKVVVVDPRLSDIHKIHVLAHELAHIVCGHVADIDEYQLHRGTMETEAEATAYMIGRWAGIDTATTDAFSPGYIAGWCRGDTTVIEKALTAATAAFDTITEGDWPTT